MSLFVLIVAPRWEGLRVKAALRQPSPDPLEEGQMNLARVLLAEDHHAVAAQLRGLLQTEFEVVAVVGDGRSLLDAFVALRPDVIVSDVAMPELDGLAAATQILRQDHAARIVLVSVHDEAVLMQTATEAGVLSYVSKSMAGEQLLPAVRAALRGQRHVPDPDTPSAGH